MPLFKRFVEIGRVCLVNFGRYSGKLCVIIDVVDQNRILIDGPYALTHVPRQVINLKRISLTPFKVTIGRNSRHKTLVKAVKDSKVFESFDKSSWGRKLIARKIKSNLCDFDRFKSMRISKKRSAMIRLEFGALKKQFCRKLTQHKQARAAKVREITKEQREKKLAVFKQKNLEKTKLIKRKKNTLRKEKKKVRKERRQKRLAKLVASGKAPAATTSTTTAKKAAPKKTPTKKIVKKKTSHKKNTHKKTFHKKISHKKISHKKGSGKKVATPVTATTTSTQ
eukprot:TRINITY_DN4291_c0_g1_i1.p1 TRINITY_DN4291_c0_g1~~TRINITY_DN4291_c0_g1_i1.p1  ORF type:complete len:281 (-),score=107.45 TRINITY_DN4291_c0_g1_i1:139-981(-)